MTAEPWWRNAVFYRIVPGSFQDSNGDGVGDLAGVALRLGYLQRLGVDAVVLEPAPGAAAIDDKDSAGFDALMTAASQRRIRIVVAMRMSAAVNVVAAGRAWLARGAAGVELLLPGAAPETPQATAAADALTALRQAARSLPGERAVLAAYEDANVPAITRASMARGADLAEVEINYVGPMAAAPVNSQQMAGLAGNLRQAMLHAQAAASSPTPALLLASDETVRSAAAYSLDSSAQRTLGINEAIAAMLLTSTGAPAMLYGQELGIEKPELDATMQWTPSNVTPPGALLPEQLAAELALPEEATPAPKPAPRPDPNVYGAYVPYVPPKKVVPLKDRPFDPNALYGFSTHAPAAAAEPENTASADFSARGAYTVSGPVAAADGARNAAMEDHDPWSLLNFYRKLVQLHRGNEALRSGMERVFDHDAENALVWVRRAGTGVRTSSPVIVVCNLSAQPLTISLDADLAQLKIRPGALHTLLGSSPDTPFETTGRVHLPPYAVYVGEMYR